MQFQRSGSLEQTLMQSGELCLKGDSHGLYNPLAWENMPSVLKQKFPHWKDSSPVMKSPPKDKSSEDLCFPFSTSFKQPAHTIPYIVMECDSLNGIALKFDTTPSELALLNKKPPGLTFQLLPGEVLYVPDGELVLPPAGDPSAATPSGDPSAATSSGDPSAAPPSGGLMGSHESQDTLQSSSSSQEEQPRDRVLSMSSGCGLFELSSEWYTGAQEEVTDSHISISAKYMTNDQGCAHGTLMLSTTVLLFQPHCGDPLVKEEGKEAFELAVPIQDISYAALTRECRPPGRKTRTAAATPPPFDTTLTDDPRDQQPFAEPAGSRGNDGNASPSGGNLPSDSMGGENPRSQTSPEVEAMAQNGVRMSELLHNPLDTSGKSEAEDTLSSPEPQELEEEDPVTPIPSLEINEEGSPQLSNSVSETSLVVIVDNDTQRTESESVGDPGGSTEAKLEFDVELTNACADTHEEMLEIMGAAVPNAKPSDAANETESNSGVDDDTELSPRLDNPHFLHVRVVPKSGASHTYTPLSTRGIQIPQDRSQRGNSPVYQVRTAFCFAIREKRINDIAKFLSTHHPHALAKKSTPSEEHWSDGSYEIITAENPDMDLSFHDNFYKEVSSSWEVYSLKDISRFRNRIDRMEVEASLPLPTLSEETDLMQENHLRSLSQKLAWHAVGNNWYLIYSTFKHGISLRTLYRSMLTLDRDSPVLLLVRDDSKKLFGALLSCPLRISDHFYGTGDSFLFSFCEPNDELKVYNWSGSNHYIVKGNSDSIGIGSGDGHFGLWLDEYFYHGSSYSCSTFDNECLAGKQDFICSGVEAWGFEIREFS